jgi:2-iminobutanoate/2-iminopropanoate deaminase
MTRKTVNPVGVHSPVSHYSQAVVVGNLVWTAGQIPIDKNGDLVGKGDCVVQTHQVYQNLKAVLEGVGSSMDNIIKLNTYIVDVKDAKRIRGIKSQYIKQDPPGSTLVIVEALAYPNLLIEMEAVAFIA